MTHKLDPQLYGQNVENPLFKNNFSGIKYSLFSLKSRNLFLAHKMLKMISKESSEKQLIEIHHFNPILNLPHYS